MVLAEGEMREVVGWSMALAEGEKREAVGWGTGTETFAIQMK